MDLDIVRGEQIPIEIELKDENDEILQPSQLTEITMTCRKQPYKQSNILFQKKLSQNEITFDDGKYIINLLEDDTKDLQYETYGYDIKVESGNVIEKFVGTLTIKEEYTMGYADESE